ncbi:rod shape-determining protein MreD [Herbaspirillum rubrisubalbicans]|jgi:rod shape-determining protein MreD|uniref:Rod shape-determining protein MreD n=2 Tax=Herbaspirillum rubrisubalbicans TaxID=80842 RepID=A0ABX9BWB0_9BURK|nr:MULTISPECIES: rod shape-determining protein MreD [Herbaspirillum]MCP1575183.1 rod shape-determining protein MreD [Herbaspirillum rubrisubalbicans]NQE49848.1 rod shape-determining protein MreD [Herbaspirillum rubrisubalbicans]QJQ03677.1 rod shape-determining protein MreD [Herbaspirillum rubrisubalbicans Os34]RAM61979.1 rod shape-determining protein MreD [Herbaspirillum rubrisubalbicans]RAN43294.1 rod shape-determining protein MreD [Herbaspirillum rubrisubalbicans]
MNNQTILLPASPLFIAFSLIVAFVLNLMPWGQMVGVPDFVALALVFWNIHQPRKVGISAAFLMGLLMDVNESTLLGENALAYTLLSYFAIMIHRRVLWFPLRTQALHVLPLMLLAQAVQLVIQLLVTGKSPDWFYFSESVVSALLWPVVSVLLLAPQRRAVDRDENRPI